MWVSALYSVTLYVSQSNRFLKSSLVVKNELSKLLDYTDQKEITSKFSSFNNTSCT